VRCLPDDDKQKAGDGDGFTSRARKQSISLVDAAQLAIVSHEEKKRKNEEL